MVSEDELDDIQDIIENKMIYHEIGEYNDNDRRIVKIYESLLAENMEKYWTVIDGNLNV